MKIGILGGTFDPIHNGHLMLGEYAYRNFHLDQVWFMPNGNPPHKSGRSERAHTKKRVEMVKRAILGTEYFVLQSYEIENEAVHYSYATMQYFNRTYPEDEFYFIIGADSLFSMDEWVCPEIFLKECVVLAAYRDEKGTKEMLAQIQYLNQKYGADIRLLRTPNVDISSSDIREKCKAGKSICEYVPKLVSSYIEEKGLYRG